MENYKNISKKITVKELFSIIEILNKYSFEMKNNNNSKLLFELSFIKIISEKNKKNVENIQEISNNFPKIPSPITKKAENVPKIDKNVEKQEKSVEKSEIKQTSYDEKANIHSLAQQNNQKNILQKTNSSNTSLKANIEKIKQIRIDNTLARFSKQEVRNITPSLELLNDLLLDPEYSHAASIILDGTLKAASPDNLIFVFKTKRLSDLFNENLIIIEETIEKILNKKYNLIANDFDEWEIIKNDFNHKLRPFIYKEEQFNLEDIFKEEDNKNNIESMFEDIIEYN